MSGGVDGNGERKATEILEMEGGVLEKEKDILQKEKQILEKATVNKDATGKEQVVVD
eukprot:gene46424-56091_t